MGKKACQASSFFAVSVFNRNGLRFIRNEANISNLTTFHCIYLNLFSEPKVDLLFAYLLTDISKEIFNDNRREYGNGLHKFEPNDINKALMVDLDKIGKKDEEEILLYDKFKTIIHELDNLTNISQADTDEEKEDILGIEMSSFVDGINKSLIRLPKSKRNEVSNIEHLIKSKLSKDKTLNIAALANILKDLLKK